VKEIRHIVLDVGRVLIHYDPHLAFRALIPDDAARAEFFRDVCTHDWNIEQDRGRTWAEAEAELIPKHPDKADLIRAFRGNWHMMVPHEYPESVALMRALLAGGRDVTLLTNFAADTFREAQERFPILKEGRGVTVSAAIRALKPEPAIYAHHTKAFGLDPKATLFFDDSPANVEGARSAGWNAEVFTGAEKMRGDLGRYGVRV
jgi:2-haloacid dehalogenase